MNTLKATLLAGVTALGAAASIGIAHAASAPDSTPWGQAGPWQIFSDRTLGNGCFMMSEYSTGQVLRVGYDNIRHHGYILIVDLAWKSLEAGKVYQLTADMDGSRDQWQASAIPLGNITGLSVVFSDADPSVTLNVFGFKNHLRLWYEGQPLVSLSLKGTAAAAAETTRCNQTYLTVQPAPSDPFKAPSPQAPASKPDPFAV